VFGNRIRVLIVDDHQVVRQGLRTFLELQPDIEVSGEAADGLTAVEMTMRLKPDIVLMDLVMPELDGIGAIRQITAAGLPVRVIALTSFAGDENIFPALEAGASSYLLKDVTPENLVEAVRATCHGETRLHPEVAKKLMARAVHPPCRESLPEELTEREMDVIRLVGQGFNNRDIGQKLFISEKTVKNHLSAIFNKLGVADRLELTLYVFEKRMFSPNME
jgi:NarL family two-component system response regulator LiaR